MAEISIKDSQLSVIPETQQAADEQIDTEIATLRSQIKSLTHRRSILTASLLASPSTQTLLTRTSPSPSPPSPAPKPTTSTTTSTASARPPPHSPCTTPPPRPDPPPRHPHRSLLRPLPHPPAPLLPPPLASLPRHPRPAHPPPHHPALHPPARPRRQTPPPTPAAGAATKAAPAQDLPRLVRELRREVAGYHLRMGAVERVRAGLVGKGVGAEVKDVRVGDAEGREVRIEWKDGAVGRVRIGKEGGLERAVVFVEGGRARGWRGSWWVGRGGWRDLWRG
ncbi:MAG: hypothetical protein FRX48_08067 [Lasallia pustulata]|uniref:Uncharacterized protein n=1 Tax=Lasallia pustulata TaxID=136370 RepID=A0A5M8PGC2_9LECA|nr:MAG: hypothetical protein FRX48_08067 [Lasallia pustulata]